MTSIYASESINPSSLRNSVLGLHRLRVRSVENMVDQVLRILGKYSGGGHFLTIGGAGIQNYHSVGGGAYDPHGGKSLQVDAKGHLKGPAQAQMQRLRGIVYRVRLVQNHDSTDLLLAIAKALGPNSQACTNQSLLAYYGEYKPVRRQKVSVKDIELQGGALFNELRKREGGKTVQVTRFDHPRSTLSGIAQAEYGDWKLWPLIYDVNESLIGSNPNRLQPGLQLMVMPISHYKPHEIADAKRRAPSWKAY